MPADTADTRPVKLLKLSEAADQLGCSRRHMYNLINRGEIATVRQTGPKGNPWGHRIEQSEIHAYIARNRQPAQAPTAS